MRALMTISLLLACLMFAAPAMAHSCPRHIAQIDHALEHQDLPDEVADQVTKLRDEGEAAHEAGDHDTAMEKLGQAIELVGEEGFGIDAY